MDSTFSSRYPYVLTPAYDLICTKLHLPNESRLALDLFADDEIPQGVLTHGFATGADFLELADRFGINEQRAEAIIRDLCGHHEAIDRLVERSFRSGPAKETYQAILADRQKALKII